MFSLFMAMINAFHTDPMYIAAIKVASTPYNQKLVTAKLPLPPLLGLEEAATELPAVVVVTEVETAAVEEGFPVGSGVVTVAGRV
jgi:hypothetical protein